MYTMSADAKSEVRGTAWREVRRGMKSLLEVVSLGVLVESVGTVTGVQSWRPIVSDVRRCDREAMSA